MKLPGSPSSRAGRALAPLLLLPILGGCGSLLAGSHGHGPPSAGLDVTMPPGAPSISQAFRPLDPVHAADPMNEHDGIDIVAPGGTPVIAAAAGRVVRSHLTVIRGHRVVVEHGKNPDGEVVSTEYVHLKKRLVAEGQRVARGAPVGELGMTGLTAGYPHLHFMVVVAHAGEDAEEGRAADPHLYWAKGRGQVTCLGEEAQGTGLFPFLTYPVPCREKAR